MHRGHTSASRLEEHVRSLQLGSSEVAVVRSRVDSGQPQIFDREANEISDTFRDTAQFERLYERNTPACQTGRWEKVKGWGTKVVGKVRKSSRRHRESGLEIWCAKMEQHK